MENGSVVVNTVLRRRTIQTRTKILGVFVPHTRERLEVIKCEIRVEIVLLVRRFGHITQTRTEILDVFAPHTRQRLEVMKCEIRVEIVLLVRS